jgi:hypothetical protein
LAIPFTGGLFWQFSGASGPFWQNFASWSRQPSPSYQGAEPVMPCVNQPSLAYVYARSYPILQEKSHITPRFGVINAQNIEIKYLLQLTQIFV